MKDVRRTVGDALRRTGQSLADITHQRVPSSEPAVFASRAPIPQLSVICLRAAVTRRRLDRVSSC